MKIPRDYPKFSFHSFFSYCLLASFHSSGFRFFQLNFSHSIPHHLLLDLTVWADGVSEVLCFLSILNFPSRASCREKNSGEAMSCSKVFCVWNWNIAFFVCSRTSSGTYHLYLFFKINSKQWRTYEQNRRKTLVSAKSTRFIYILYVFHSLFRSFQFVLMLCSTSSVWCGILVGWG